jgi:hypothetical protein
MNGKLIRRRHEVTLFASGDRGRNQASRPATSALTSLTRISRLRGNLRPRTQVQLIELAEQQPTSSGDPVPARTDRRQAAPVVLDVSPFSLAERTAFVGRESEGGAIRATIDRALTNATVREGRRWCTTAGPRGASLPCERERWNLRAPRVNDRRRGEQGQRQRFTSHILPPYRHRSPKVAEVRPSRICAGSLSVNFSTMRFLRMKVRCRPPSKKCRI